MALGRTSTRGRMRNAAMQRASQQRAVAQQRSPEAFNQALNRKMESIPEVRALKSFGASIGNRQPTPQELQKLQSLQTAVQNNAAFKAIERESRAFETQNQQRMQAQNATRTISQKSPNLVAAPQKPAAMPKQAAGQMAAFNAAQNKNTQGANMNAVMQRSMQQFNQAPAATRAPAQQATYKQPTMSQVDVFNQSADINKQLGALETQAQMARANAPKMPAMRKGGAVKKKPGYAKGGMVMANCGASMKPQQQRKK